LEKELMAVDFDPLAITASAPRLLFPTGIVAAGRAGFQYDVAPDGRFLIPQVSERSDILLRSFRRISFGSQLQHIPDGYSGTFEDQAPPVNPAVGDKILSDRFAKALMGPNRPVLVRS
jgi:hypothetical protein